MRYASLFLWIFAAVLSSNSYGQSPRSLEQLSEALVQNITTATELSDSTFITLEEYHRVIDRQPISRSQQSQLKQDVNESYPGQKTDFLAELVNLQRIYVNEVNSGASISIDTIYFEEMPETYNLFEVRIVLSFTYEDEEDNSTYYLDTMAATTRRRWSFISPVVEGYD